MLFNGWYFLCLRVQDLLHKTDGIYHVNFTFPPGFTYQTTVIFGKIRDGSLFIHSLASFNCLSKNLFQKSANALSNMVKKNGFLSKRSKFRVVRTIRLCSNFTSKWYKYLLWNVWRDFRLPMSASATVSWKSFNVKFAAKINVLIGYFVLPLLKLTLEG